MASGFRKGATDLDDIFDPYVEGIKPAATGFKAAGGIDLNQRYAPLAYGTQAAATGITTGGIDLNTLWAAKGTARYVSDGGLPPAIDAWRDISPPNGGTASASFEYKADGTVSWHEVPGGSFGGVWLTNGAGGNYDIRFDINSGSGFSGETGSWLRMDVPRGGGVSVTVPPGNSETSAGATTVVRFRIRERASGAIVVDRAVTLWAQASRVPL